MNVAISPISGFKCDHHTGCICSIECRDGSLPVDSWGCEVGNWHGFFSQAKMGGSCVEIERRNVLVELNRVVVRVEFRLPHGHFEFVGTDALEHGEIRRDYRLIAKCDSFLGDFVVRAAFRSEDWLHGGIPGKVWRHRSGNTMYQYPCQSACVWNDHEEVDFRTLNVVSPDTLDNLIYLRDEPSGLWILHHRLLTRDGACDEYVLRVRHNIWSSQKSSFVTNRWIRRLLWRFAERVPLRIPTILSGGNILMKAGQELVMVCAMSLRERCMTNSHESMHLE